jgi:hypothetical protein
LHINKLAGDKHNIDKVLKKINSINYVFNTSNKLNIDIKKRMLKGKLMNLLNKRLVTPIPDIIPDVI